MINRVELVAESSAQTNITRSGLPTPDVVNVLVANVDNAVLDSPTCKSLVPFIVRVIGGATDNH